MISRGVYSRDIRRCARNIRRLAVLRLELRTVGGEVLVALGRDLHVLGNAATGRAVGDIRRDL